MSIDKDISPKIITEVGSYHPINQTKAYLISMLSDFGFTSLDDVIALKEASHKRIGND